MTKERLEQLVEGAAGRFDRSMNRAWEHRPVRLMGGALSRSPAPDSSPRPCPWLRRAVPRRPGYAWPPVAWSPGGGRPHPVPPPEMSHPFSLGEKRQPAVLGRLALFSHRGATLSPPPGGPAGRCTGGSGGC